MKKHIPNAITLLNVLSGCIAILFAVKGQLQWAAIFVFIGIVFDFFDGLAARLLHVKSELGVQLDSLADMITSGVVPGIVMFQLFNMSLFDAEGVWGNYGEASNSVMWFGLKLVPLSLAGFLITLAAAYRLAKFNIDTRQADSFIGLPTPANTIFITAFPLLYLQACQSDAFDSIIFEVVKPIYFIPTITIFSILLVSEIPLIA